MMKISVIYPICGLPPSDPNGMPHSFLLGSLDSILAAGSQNFELLVGIDGDRPWVLAFLRYWAARHQIRPEQMRIVPMAFSGTYGNRQRNLLMKLATGDYISFLDHDDAYNPGAFDAIDNIARQAPGRPIFFKMNVYQFQSTEAPRSEPFTLWRQETLGHIVQAMVGGHMFVVPNRQDLLSIWPTSIYEADYHFIRNTVDNFREHGIEPVWADFVISEVRPWARWWNGLA
jgi:hypothetical protein